MKRLATLAGLALAALFGSFTMSAPAHATPVSCTTVTQGGTNTYPQNYLWICNGSGTVTTGDKNAVEGALAKLGGVAAGTVSDAKTRMASNQHYIYVFANDDDYNGANAYCTGTGDGNNTANPPIPGCHALKSSEVALTTIDNATGIDQTVIIESRVNAATNTNMANTAAHEAGHQLDSIYGIKIYGSGLASAPPNEFSFKLNGETVVYTGGPITAGDVMKLTFQGTSLSPVTVSYTVLSTDTLTTIASGMKAAINANGTLTGAPVNMVATSSGATLTIKNSTILTYSQSTTGVGGHAANETQNLSNYDWPAFDALNGCVINTGAFSQHKDVNGVFICSSIVQGTVGGTVTAGDIVAITITDTALGVNNPQHATYTVQAGDTTTKIAQQLAASINGNGLLSASGVRITATSSGSTVNISSGTNATTYAPSLSIGATETLTGLGTVTGGNGATLSNTYSSYTTNDAVLTHAWPHYFTNADSALWAELFAEETAEVASSVAPLGATQDDYLGSGRFICSKNFVNAVENTGNPPDATHFPYSSACK